MFIQHAYKFSYLKILIELAILTFIHISFFFYECLHSFSFLINLFLWMNLIFLPIHQEFWRQLSTGFNKYTFTCKSHSLMMINTIWIYLNDSQISISSSNYLDSLVLHTQRARVCVHTHTHTLLLSEVGFKIFSKLTPSSINLEILSIFIF